MQTTMNVQRASVTADPDIPGCDLTFTHFDDEVVLEGAIDGETGLLEKIILAYAEAGLNEDLAIALRKIKAHFDESPDEEPDETPPSVGPFELTASLLEYPEGITAREMAQAMVPRLTLDIAAAFDRDLRLGARRVIDPETSQYRRRDGQVVWERA